MFIFIYLFEFITTIRFPPLVTLLKFDFRPGIFMISGLRTAEVLESYS